MRAQANSIGHRAKAMALEAGSNSPMKATFLCAWYSLLLTPICLTSKHIADSNIKPDKEIAGCISDIGVPCTIEDIQKPSPQHIQKVFEHCAELILNVTRESVDPAMRAAAQDVCGDYSEVVPVDTRNLMGFFKSMRILLVEVGPPSLEFQIAPEVSRLIFNYI